MPQMFKCEVLNTTHGKIYQNTDLNHFYTCTSVALRTFTLLCIHHHSPASQVYRSTFKLCTLQLILTIFLVKVKVPTTIIFSCLLT